MSILSAERQGQVECFGRRGLLSQIALLLRHVGQRQAAFPGVGERFCVIQGEPDHAIPLSRHVALIISLGDREERQRLALRVVDFAEQLFGRSERGRGPVAVVGGALGLSHPGQRLCLLSGRLDLGGGVQRRVDRPFRRRILVERGVGFGHHGQRRPSWPQGRRSNRRPSRQVAACRQRRQCPSPCPAGSRS